MATKQKIGGYRYREHIGNGRAANRKIRALIGEIVERGPNPAELYQILTAVALLSAQVDDLFTDLEQYGGDLD